MTMEQLGGWVRERRKQLGLTQEEVAAIAPMSDKTLRTVEAGKATGIRRPTRRALERALGWEPGSVDEAIDGGRQPRPADGTAAAEDRLPGLPQVTEVPGAPEEPSSFSAARSVLAMKRLIPTMRDRLEPAQFEELCANLLDSQRQAEIAVTQAMQFIVKDDAKRREAAQLLYELQQPL